jgi:hypothetical protein
MGGIFLPEVFGADYVAQYELRVVAQEGIPAMLVLAECERVGGRKTTNLAANVVSITEEEFRLRLAQGFRELKSHAEEVEAA